MADGRGRPSKIPAIKSRIRSAILQGHYKQDEQLPPLDEFARQYHVAGVTMKLAVRELVKEGWLRSRQGAGTFVQIRKSPSLIVLTAPRQYGSETFLNTENLDAFHKAHPNVRIVLSADTPTDLVVTDSYGLVADRVRAQQLHSLDELWVRFRREPWKLPAMIRTLACWQGAQFALPMRANVLLLQSNPGLIRSAGIVPPEKQIDWQQYGEVLERCRFDRDGDGFAECCGAYSTLRLYEWLVPFWQNGGRLDEREAFFRSGAFSMLDQLWRMHHLKRTMPVEMSLSHGEITTETIRTRFENEQIAIRWISPLAMYRRAPFPTNILLPAFGPIQRQQAHAVVLGIHRNCPHPDLALEFLDFCYQRFIAGNTEYPFALDAEQRQFLRQMPPIHRLLMEALSSGIEPLHEGVPQRTWAIEKDILHWFRLLQDGKTMRAKLEGHWDRWPSASGSEEEAESSLVMPGDESPFHSVPQLMEAS